MSIPSFSVHQRVLVNLLFLGLMVTGIFFFRRTPMELYPDITFHKAYVATIFPGGSPEEVEQLVTIPIEREIADVPNIATLSSTTRQNLSVIMVIFEDNVKDIQDCISELRAEVAKVKNLPEEIRGPMVFRARITEHVPILVVCMAAETESNILRQFAENLRAELRKLDGVADAHISGVLEREIEVAVHSDRLDRLHLSLNEVMGGLSMGNMNVPCGRVNAGSKEWLVRLVGQWESLEEIRDVVVRQSQAGQVLVGDVATVSDTFKRPLALSRLDGKECVTLAITKKPDANAVTLVKDARKVTDRFASSASVDLDISYRHDTSKDIIGRLSVLGNNGLIGMVLVGISLTMFVGIRASILAAIGIPFCFLCTMIFCHIGNITINMVSVFAFVLVLGMVVDDAIVLIENVVRKMEMGLPAKEAAIKGSEEVMWPVTVAVLTTMAAFLPLLAMQGFIGKFLQLIPKIVTFVLVASLVEALVILPSHMADFVRLPKKRTQRPLGGKALDSLRGFYLRLLKWCVHHRYLTILTVFASAAFCVHIGRNLDRMLFAEEEEDQIQIQFKTTPACSMNSTDQVARDIEARIAQIPEGVIQAVLCQTGMQVFEYERVYSNHIGQIDIDLFPGKTRPLSIEDTIAMIRNELDGVPGLISVSVRQPQKAHQMGSPVEVRVKGPRFDRLAELSQEVFRVLKEIPGVEDLQSSHEIGKKELRISVDSDKAAMMGLSVGEVAMTVRTALEGTSVTTYFDHDREVDVVVRYDTSTEDRLMLLENMRLMNRRGEQVGLKEVAHLNLEPGIAEIRRKDGERIILLSADIDENISNADAIHRELMRHFSDFSSRYPGYTLEYGGDYAEMERSFHDLYLSLGMACMVIYLLLGAQFKSFVQPLIVMVTVPFAFIGVILGLVVMNLLFTITAFVSIVALAGIVVNDSLILVDFINRLRASGVSMEESIYQAGLLRMRPILLTSITTILGLLPLTLGWGGVSRMWSPMAASMCWGLGFSTILTLFVVPSLQRIVDDFLRNT